MTKNEKKTNIEISKSIKSQLDLEFVYFSTFKSTKKIVSTIYNFNNNLIYG